MSETPQGMTDPIADILETAYIFIQGEEHPVTDSMIKQIRQQIGQELLEKTDKTGYSVNVIDIREVCQMEETKDD